MAPETARLLILVKVAVVVAMLWFGLRWFERTNLYYPTRTLEAHPGSYGMAYEEFRVKTRDGETIHGWVIPARRPGTGIGKGSNGKTLVPFPGPVPTLLLCHGNGGNIAHRVHKAKLLHDLGVDVVLFDYRGYGQSTGKPSETGTYLDAEAVYNVIYSRGLTTPKPTRAHGQTGARANGIVLYGESLGCAVAIELARRRPVQAVILESPFTSTVEMGKLVFPFLPVQWMVHFKYDNVSKIAGLQMPLLFMHSPQDEIIPYKMGRRLFEVATADKEFVELSGGHNDGFDVSPQYTRSIEHFLDRLRAGGKG
jgi:uncharacterized protein